MRMLLPAPAASYGYSISAGGTGTAGGDGGGGGDTEFDTGAGASSLKCTGAGGGTRMGSGTAVTLTRGGAGGEGNVNELTGDVISAHGSGGSPGIRLSGSVVIGGNGGSSAFDGGGRGASTGNGEVGLQGSGGGGSVDVNNDSVRTGRAGGDGLIVVTEFYDGGIGPEGPEGPLGADALTAPTVAAIGAEWSSTGTPTVTLPTHQANDILLISVESANQTVATPAGGWARLGPANGIGTAGAAGATKLTVFWLRAVDGATAAPTIADSGDHTYGVAIAIRGCPTTGDPFHLLDQNFKRATSTTGTSGKGVTSVDQCLILDIFGHAIDSATAQGSSPTNADLSSVTEQFDDSTQDGNNGGLYIMSGIKAKAGPIGASTVTWATTTVDVSTRIAFLPELTTSLGVVSRPPETQKFFGSVADLDDTWVKPTGAKTVFAQTVDGGGGGGGGRSAATAAGGGGGGGGGYDEAWFNADDLAATVTVHAGRGGAAGSADGGGNVGVVSEFDKGNAGPLTSTRRITGIAATAPASADGGNGGSGSGRGTTSPAVQTTRLDAFGTNAARPGVGGGCAGGSGTTAPTGGGNADWGGGGGESGADTDASLTAITNGWSNRGGGGGGGGRTNTVIAIPGFGGGVAAPTTPQGGAGNDSLRLPYGGSGGIGGGSSVAAGGPGGFPGGGGGGGGGAASGTGGIGGDGIVMVTTFFS